MLAAFVIFDAPISPIVDPDRQRFKLYYHVVTYCIAHNLVHVVVAHLVEAGTKKRRIWPFTDLSAFFFFFFLLQLYGLPKFDS